MDPIEETGAPSELTHSRKLFAVQAGAWGVLALEMLVVAVVNADTNIDTGNPIAASVYLIASGVFAFAEMVGLVTGLVALAIGSVRRAGFVVLGRTLVLATAWFVLVAIGYRI